jgi:hypothetical protein
VAIDVGTALAQAPCTAQEAAQKQEVLRLDSKEQADRDARMHSKPDAVILKKVDQAIALVKEALPDFKGVRGEYWHEIFDLGPNSHVQRYTVNAMFRDYFCVPVKGHAPDAGKIRVADETQTSIHISFNTLGVFVNERLSLGPEMAKANGRAIFELPNENGQWKGHRLFEPRIQGQMAEAVILTPANRFPFKPVSREQFLRAREKVLEGYVNEARAKVGANSAAARERERQLEEMKRYHASMSPAELQSQAVVREWSGSPSYGRIFASSPAEGLRLVQVDETYIDPARPRTSVQLIVVHWTWEEEVPAKKEVIRRFKNNLDFATLQKMLDP